MKKIYFYISKEFLIFFIFCFLSFIFLFLTFTGIIRSSEGELKQYGMFVFFLRIISDVPILIEFSLPFIVLLATTLCFSSLSKSSELIVMKSIGLSILQMIKPVLFISFLISIFFYINQSYITHQLNSNIYIDSYGINSGNNHLDDLYLWKQERRNLFYLKNNSKTSFEQIILFAFNANNQLQKKEMFDQVVVSDDSWKSTASKTWDFSNGTYTYQEERQKIFKPLFENNFKNKEIVPQYLSFEALYHKIQTNKKNDLDVTSFSQAFFKKISGMLQIPLMILLAIPFAIFSPRNSKVGLKIVTAILLGFLFWLSEQIFTAFSISPNIPFWISAFGTNLIFFILAISLILKKI